MTLVLAALGVADDALGAALYSAHIYHNGNNQYLLQQSTATPPLYIQGSGVHNTSNYSYAAGAYPGLLDVVFTNSDFSPTAVGVEKECAVSALVDDLVITDGTGVSKPVSVFVRFDVQGAATIAGQGGNGNNFVDVDGRIQVTLGSTVTSMWSPAGGSFSSPWPSSGAFTGIATPTLQGTFQVGPFNISTETPRTLKLTNIVWVAPSAYTGGWIEGSCRLAASLTRSTPAIVLPPGFVANSAQGQIIDSWFVGSVTDVVEGGVRRSGLELAQNAPNPFLGETAIAYSLPRGGSVRLQVFDVNGTRVAELVAGEQGPGPHTVRWNGLDSAGRRAGPGVYFYALEANGERAMRRMVLLK